MKHERGENEQMKANKSRGKPLIIAQAIRALAGIFGQQQ
jgi:hypothetical protein